MDHVAINDRPWVHEDNLEVEQDEEHRDQVKLYAEPRLRLTDRHHAAFVGGIFDWSTATGFAQQYTNDQSRGRETDRDNNLQQNWKIISQHAALAAAEELSDCCYWNMAVLGRNRARQSRRQALIFLAVLFYGATRDQVLQLFISAQTQHFLATACGVAGAEVFVDDVEELFKLERRPTRKHRDEFLGHEIRNPT
jgi:hypothetical protein